MKKNLVAILAASAPLTAQGSIIAFDQLSPVNSGNQAIGFNRTSEPTMLAVGGNGTTSSYFPTNLAAGNQGSPFNFLNIARDAESVGNELYSINAGGGISKYLSPDTQTATLDEAFGLAHLFGTTFAAFGDYNGQSTMVTLDFATGTQSSQTLPYYVFGATGLGQINGTYHILVSDADGRVKQLDLGASGVSSPLQLAEWNVTGLANLEDMAYDGSRLYAVDPERVGSAPFQPVPAPGPLALGALGAYVAASRRRK